MEVTINIMDYIDQYIEVDICPSEVDLDAVVAHHGDDVLEYLCPKACLDYVVPDLDPETVIQAVVDNKGTEALIQGLANAGVEQVTLTTEACLDYLSSQETMENKDMQRLLALVRRVLERVPEEGLAIYLATCFSYNKTSEPTKN